MALHDRAEHLLLLVLHQVRTGAGEGQPDDVREQLPDAAEVAAVARRQYGGDEIAGDHELRASDDSADRLGRETGEETATSGFPHDLERRREHARDAAQRASFLGWLEVTVAGEHLMSILRDRKMDTVAGVL